MLPLIIDLFAGGGGASTGFRLALGRDPDVAAALIRANCAHLATAADARRGREASHA